LTFVAYARSLFIVLHLFPFHYWVERELLLETDANENFVILGF
jgi:hypothetical protein